MREYQEVGLTVAAEEFISKNTKKTVKDYCPHYGKGIGEKLSSRIYKEVDLFYGDGPKLKEYTLLDGSKVKEIVQAEPWSSGPVAFFCLQKEDGTLMFQWTKEEMDAWL